MKGMLLVFGMMLSCAACYPIMAKVVGSPIATPDDTKELRRELDATKAAQVRQAEAYHNAVAQVGAAYRRGLRDGEARVSCQRKVTP